MPFFSQNFVEFLAFGESLDGGASFNIRHVPYLDDYVHVVFQDFPIEGFDEVDCYSLASFHTLGESCVSPMIAIFHGAVSSASAG